jgi:hypothetical protein
MVEKKTNRKRIFDLIGKRISGIQIENLNKEQDEASILLILFEDGTELKINEKYLDGWCGFYISVEKK